MRRDPAALEAAWLWNHLDVIDQALIVRCNVERYMVAQHGIGLRPLVPLLSEDLMSDYKGAALMVTSCPKPGT